jgi:fused signal recognition particle receptor
MDLVFIIPLAAVFILFVGGLLFRNFKKTKPSLEAAKEQAVLKEVPTQLASPPPQASSLEKKLEKTRGSLLGRLTQFLNRGDLSGLSQQDWDQIEEVLLEADVGFGTSQWLLDSAKEKIKSQKDLGLKQVLHEVSSHLFHSLKNGKLEVLDQPKPLVISVVGINGAGKTTTIGKLAHQLQSSGKTVLLGAVDTFRAGAISQLKVWAERTGAQFVTGREGADPGAVAFDSVTAGKARGVDVVLLDTAGRLHTKSNLMEELKKIHRVIKKVIPEAPHETWLVIDGTLGQNSVVQAKEFQKALDLTGVIVTKLDGTAKGGAVLAIASELKLPIRYIGVGESVEDLTPFEPKSFVDAILS